MSIRVVIADDDAMVLGGLAAILDAQPDMDVVGRAGDGVEAISAVREMAPDVVVMDVRMPRLDGIEATARIVRETPAAAVLVITTFEHDSYALEALRAGAAGFLLKRSGAELLVQAVRTVATGDAVLFPARIRDLVHEVVAVGDRCRTWLRVRNRCCACSLGECPTLRSVLNSSSGSRPSRRTSGLCSPGSTPATARRLWWRLTSPVS